MSKKAHHAVGNTTATKQRTISENASKQNLDESKDNESTPIFSRTGIVDGVVKGNTYFTTSEARRTEPGLPDGFVFEPKCLRDAVKAGATRVVVRDIKSHLAYWVSFDDLRAKCWVTFFRIDVGVALEIEHFWIVGDPSGRQLPLFRESE